MSPCSNFIISILFMAVPRYWVQCNGLNFLVAFRSRRYCGSNLCRKQISSLFSVRNEENIESFGHLIFIELLLYQFLYDFLLRFATSTSWLCRGFQKGFYYLYRFRRHNTVKRVFSLRFQMINLDTNNCFF